MHSNICKFDKNASIYKDETDMKKDSRVNHARYVKRHDVLAAKFKLIIL